MGKNHRVTHSTLCCFEDNKVDTVKLDNIVFHENRTGHIDLFWWGELFKKMVFKKLCIETEANYHKNLNCEIFGPEL